MKDKGKNRDSKSGKFRKGNVAALKHGLYAFKLTGKVPSVRGARALMRDLGRIKDELEIITPGMNVKKSLLIDQAVKAQGFMRLFEMYIKQSGLIDPRLYSKNVIDFQPGFKTYLSFAAQQHKVLMALGLETTKEDEPLDALAYIKKFDEAKKGK